MSYFVITPTHLPVNIRITIYNSSLQRSLGEAWFRLGLWHTLGVSLQRSLSEAWFRLGLCRWCLGECNVPITSLGDFSLFYTLVTNHAGKYTSTSLSWSPSFNNTFIPLNIIKTKLNLSIKIQYKIPCFMHKLDKCKFMQTFFYCRENNNWYTRMINMIMKCLILQQLNLLMTKSQTWTITWTQTVWITLTQ